MLTATVTARRQRRANTLARWLERVDDGLHLGEVTLMPFLDLAIRLWLAQIFMDIRRSQAGELG